MAKFILPFIIILVAILATIGLVKNRSEPEQSEVIPTTILVDVINIQTQDSYISVASQGTVEPRTRTNLISEVAGRVIEVSPAFVAGGFFHEGDVLLRLDSQNYQAAVSRDQAAVAAAKSQLEQERGQGDVAQREWDRMSSERQNQVTAKNLYLRQPQLEEALARLAAAEADLARSRNDLSKTTVLAPYDGLVSSKSTDIGQFVTTGASIAETFAIDYAEVRLPIPESKITFLELPTALSSFKSAGNGSSATESALDKLEVELSSKVGDIENSWSGKLIRTEAVLDTRTRVLFSVVQIEDPYNLYNNSAAEPLRIGTYVNASIQGRLLEDVIVLPRHTLQANNIVWVADPEGKLRARNVSVVTINGDNVYISGGFESGDKVVITRLENPLNGAQLQSRIQQSYISIE